MQVNRQIGRRWSASTIIEAICDAPSVRGRSGGAGEATIRSSASRQLAREQRVVIDEAASEDAGHVRDEHVVFSEVAPRRVQHAGSVRDALCDDPVAWFGRDDVAGADEIFVAQSGSVEAFLGDLQQAGRRIRAKPGFVAECEHDAVVLQAIQPGDVESIDAVPAERRKHQRSIERQAEPRPDLIARVGRVPSDERHVDDSIERREAAVHREAPSRGRAPVGAPDRGEEIGRVRELPPHRPRRSSPR